MPVPLILGQVETVQVLRDLPEFGLHLVIIDLYAVDMRPAKALGGCSSAGPI